MNESLHLKASLKDKMKEHFSRKLIGFLLLVILAIYILSLIPIQVAYANQSTSRSESYMSIEIKSGDSLWSIAKTYFSDDYKSINDYIQRIQKCNALIDEKITAGCYLVIPYYN